MAAWREGIQNARHLFRPGDVLVVLMAICACVALTQGAWFGPGGDRVVVRGGGRVVAELPLARNRVLEVSGPLGISRVEISGGRVRVANDPGPRQICVRRGWLQRSGDAALCAANNVSVEVLGGARSYDSRAF